MISSREGMTWYPNSIYTYPNNITALPPLLKPTSINIINIQSTPKQRPPFSSPLIIAIIHPLTTPRRRRRDAKILQTPPSPL